MPPMRNPPVKTERTHEENQERAYIAASRRSDRSLEARVESARRASEIHKKRTGRSLKVTEQDVINEEMYEEDDDDHLLQSKFTGVPSYLKTQDEAYNRKLHAYLSHTLSMRQAAGNIYTPSPGYGAQMGMQPQQNVQMYQRHQPYPTTNASMGQSSRSASTSAASGTSSQTISPKTQPEQIRRHSTNTGAPESQAVFKQENIPSTSSQSAVPATQYNYANMQQPLPQTMQAPYSLSQEVYPGQEARYYRHTFTDELPLNAQMMGFSSTGDVQNLNAFNFNASGNTSAHNNKSDSSMKIKALSQTLPYMRPQTLGEQQNFSRQSSFQGFEQQNEQVPLSDQANLDDDWVARLFADTSYENYAGTSGNSIFSERSQDNQHTTMSPINDEK